MKAGLPGGTMSKKVLVLLSLVLVSRLFAQELKKEYYDEGKRLIREEYTLVEGKKNGLHKKYFENGIVAAELPCKDGKPNGLCKFYYEPGGLRFEKNYKAGIQDGPMKEYDGAGKVISENTFLNGKIEGESRSYSGGKLVKLYNFKNGLKHGVSTDFYPDGSKLRDTPYLNGNINGIEKEYDNKGNLITETEYKKGRKNGASTSFLNGKVSSVTEFKAGVPAGLKKYDDEGNVWMEKTYSGEGKPVPFKVLAAASQRKLSPAERKEYETKLALVEMRKYAKACASDIQKEGVKGFKKKLLKLSGGSIPLDAVCDSSLITGTFTGKGGWFLDRSSGEVFLNIKGTDSKGGTYCDYPDTAAGE